MTTERLRSDDGYFEWDGAQWVPAQQQPEPVREYKISRVYRSVDDMRVAKAVKRGERLIVRTYKDPKEYEKDAPKMAEAGYMPEGQTAGASKAKVGHILAFGVFGLAARKDGKITVTWVRQ